MVCNQVLFFFFYHYLCSLDHLIQKKHLFVHMKPSGAVDSQVELYFSQIVLRKY